MLINISFIKTMEVEVSSPSNFDVLPNEIKATIVGFLAEERTFEQAMENFYAIARTNKEFQGIVSDKDLASRYCKDLAKRFPDATSNRSMRPGLFLSVFSRNENRLNCMQSIKELAGKIFEEMAIENQAINKGDTEFIKSAVTTIPAVGKYFAKYYKFGDEKYTALMWACKYGHKKIVGQFLKIGSDPEVKTKTSMQNALFYAAIGNASMGNQASIAKVLLQKGAKVDVKNKAGETPLIIAVKQGSFEMVRILLEARPDLGRSNSDWQRALSIAIANNWKSDDRKLILRILQEYAGWWYNCRSREVHGNKARNYK